VRAIREQIASAINVIMHLDRMPDGRRVVTSVTEIQGMEGDTILLQDVFKYRTTHRVDEDGRRVSDGELVATGLRPKFLDKLHEAGIDVPAKVFRQPPPPPSAPRGVRTTKVPSLKALAGPERAR
jgi:pilus assembly protein CpaF